MTGASCKIFAPVLNNTYMIELTLYQYSGLPNVINKTLGAGETVNGYLYDNTDIINPIIQLQSNDISYNYAYIPTFSRYYFIDSYEQTDTNFITVHLKEDVLTSYSDVIKDFKVHINSSENGNLYSSNIDNPYNLIPTKEILTFPNTVFNDGNIIMLTVKGK